MNLESALTQALPGIEEAIEETLRSGLAEAAKDPFRLAAAQSELLQLARRGTAFYDRPEIGWLYTLTCPRSWYQIQC